MWLQVSNSDTEYRSLLLLGETGTTTACRMLSTFITDTLRVGVADALGAITFTSGSRKVQISPLAFILS